MLIATDRALWLFDEAAEGEPGLLQATEILPAIDATAALAAAWVGAGDFLLSRAGAAACRLHTDLDADVQCLRILGAEPLVLLVGTEPAHLYRVTGDGCAERLEGFDRVEGRQGWDTPWGGPAAVRSLAEGGGWLYADIHVGSIARSGDGGDTWEPVAPQLHRDVHQVATSPVAPRRVCANTADAVWVSDDCGGSWRHCPVGAPCRYGRAIAVHPDDPNLLLASLSLGPHQGKGQLYRSADGGATWRHLTDGFPACVDGNIDTFCVAFGSRDEAWVAAGSTLYRSDDRGMAFRTAWEAPGEIGALACRRPA